MLQEAYKMKDSLLVVLVIHSSVEDGDGEDTLIMEDGDGEDIPITVDGTVIHTYEYNTWLREGALASFFNYFNTLTKCLSAIFDDFLLGNNIYFMKKTYDEMS